MLTHLLDLAYPPHCCVCREEIEATSRSHSHPLLCLSCQPTAEDELPSSNDSANANFCPTCQEPFHPGIGTKDRCLHCTLVPPPWEHLRSLWHYQGHPEEVIKAFKYGNHWSIGKLLATYLSDFVRRSFFDSSWDSIVAVPSSFTALQHRGFSPTAVVAGHMAHQLALPFEFRALSTPRQHIPQASLDYSERWENAQWAFEANPRLVAGKSLLLLDDVATTGSTLFAAGTALREAGAERIAAVTLARSVHFRRSRMLLLDAQLGNGAQLENGPSHQARKTASATLQHSPSAC